MRLFGIALLSAWAIAWWSTPHGERAPATHMAGALAIAGSDRVAVAWLEMPMGTGRLSPAWLHVAIVDEKDRVIPILERVDEGEIQLADAGGGRFVLATAHFSPTGDSASQPHAAYDLVVFDEHGIQRRDTFPGGTYVHAPFKWQLFAGGEHIVIRETIGGDNEIHYLPEGTTVDTRRALVGAAGNHLIRYEMQPREHKVVLFDDSVMQVAPPDCAEPAASSTSPPNLRASEVVSVVPLRGGFARLSRTNVKGCVDGMRDGKSFVYKDLDLRQFSAARLSLETQAAGDEHLVISDEREGLASARRLVLPARPGSMPRLETSTGGHFKNHDDGVHYRLFGRAGTRGLPALGTRITAGENAVVFERFAVPPFREGEPLLPSLRYDERTGLVVGGADVTPPMARALLERTSTSALGPPRTFRPDQRPLLRRLAFLPLLVLAFAALRSARLLRRLRRLAPTGSNEPLRTGPAAIEGVILSRDAEAPEGSLRIRRGHGPLRLFIDGADVLRASDVRSRREPRGDAVDVASGATVFATGTVEPGSAFRAEDTLHARRGDVVVVGCSLAEARARVTRRLTTAGAVLAAGSLLVAALALAG